MRAAWMVRVRQMEGRFAFWLALIGYNKRDKSIPQRSTQRLPGLQRRQQPGGRIDTGATQHPPILHDGDALFEFLATDDQFDARAGFFDTEEAFDCINNAHSG